MTYTIVLQTCLLSLTTKNEILVLDSDSLGLKNKIQYKWKLPYGTKSLIFT